MPAHSSGKSDVGRVRTANEDAFHVDDALGLYVVADGMGGAAGGAIASRLAIETIVGVVAESRAGVERLRGDTSVAASVAELLKRAVLAANGAILGEARNRPELRGMGCTVTAMVVGPSRAVIAHVGDSRAYVREGGKLRQVTQDHSLAAEMVRGGAMAPEVAATHAFAHVLTRAVGTHDEVEVDTAVLDLGAVDAVLLCSDGLTDHTADNDWLIREMAGRDLDSVPDALIAHANDAGGEDNITVVVVATPPAAQVVRRGLLGRIDRWLKTHTGG